MPASSAWSSPPSSATLLSRPSTWYTWHAGSIGPGRRVLDLACGTGRHSLAAAAAGAAVVGVDRDPNRLDQAAKESEHRRLPIDWVERDLAAPLTDLGRFDVVLLFNYLDRGWMPAVLDLLVPGGLLIMETFLEAQRRLGWGPERDEHLLQPGELPTLVAPLRALHGREALEPLPGERWQAVASIVAGKRSP